jgi:hypothetical protein
MYEKNKIMGTTLARIWMKNQQKTIESDTPKLMPKKNIMYAKSIQKCHRNGIVNPNLMQNCWDISFSENHRFIIVKA